MATPHYRWKPLAQMVDSIDTNVRNRGCRTVMRKLTNIVGIVTGLGLAAGVAYHRSTIVQQDQNVEQTIADLHRFERELKIRAATDGADLNSRGWPVTVDPGWFTEPPAPQNTIVTKDRPWVEIAPFEQANLLHPPIRIANSNGLASFWYNQYQGIIRTRVPPQTSDQKTLELYNRINSTQLTDLFSPGPTVPSAVNVLDSAIADGDQGGGSTGNSNRSPAVADASDDETEGDPG